MAGVNEAASAVSQGDSAASALRLLSLNEPIEFTQYTRYVLPLDGYVFWLKTASTTVLGTLHITTSKMQLEDEFPAVNTVRMSTTEPVQWFNEINPNQIWVGESRGTRFAFTRSDSQFRQSDLFAYSGVAVYPALESQLVNTGDQLKPDTLIVSNSLPIWLAMQHYAPVWLIPNNPQVTLYPSFLVPQNLRPPYGAIHIDPTQTLALQPQAVLRVTNITHNPVVVTGANHYQLMSDTVRVTLYGLTNQQAIDWADTVVNYCTDHPEFMGLMVPGFPQDEKRTQAELGVLAMKKTMSFKVSYYQQRVNDVARQLLKKAQVTIIPSY